MSFLKRILGSWYDVQPIRTVAEIAFVILPVAFLIRTVGFGLYVVPSGSMETTLLVGERFLADKFTYWWRTPKRGEIIAFNDPLYKYSSNLFVNTVQRYASFNVSNWTKRVIGIPGDRVTGTVEGGYPVVYLNGKKLDESAYVNKYPLILLWRRAPHSAGSLSADRNWDYRSYDPQVSWDQQVFYKINPLLIIRNSQTLEPESILEPGTPAPSGKDIFDVKLEKGEYWVMGDNRLGSADSREWGILREDLIHGKIVFRIFSMDTTEGYWFVDLLKNPIAFWKKIRWRRCFQRVY